MCLIRFLFGLGQFRGRNRIVRLLLRTTSVAPSRYGPLLRVRRYDSTNNASIFGSYGNEISDQIRRLRPDDVFIDIGANSGVFSLVASDVVRDGHVFAFEPNPRTFCDLCFNLRINGASNIVALNLAVSDVGRLLKIRHDPTHSGGTSLIMPQDRAGSIPQSNNEHLSVAIEPGKLDALVDVIHKRHLGIKVDVEGHEYNVLRGLCQAGLLKCADWAIVEIDQNHLDRYQASITDIYILMRDSGFSPTKGENHASHYDEIFLAN